MSNKGQIAGLGVILSIAIAVIVGTVLLSGSGGISGQAAALTTTRTVTNQTVTLAAVGGFTDIDGCVNFQGTPLVSNATTQAIVPATNYTFTTRVSPTDGLKTLTVRSDGGYWVSSAVNASYVCQIDGYAEDASTRAVVPLITLFAALGLAAIVLGAAYRKEIFG
jgi:hypothetical protein